MCKYPLDLRDYRPYWQDKYISLFGWHFTQEACEYAVSFMRKKNDKGDLVPVVPMKREEVDELLKKNSVTIQNKENHDYVFVANMARADVVGSSVPDEKHHALYIKNIADDADAGEGEIMRKWYAAMVSRGIYVDWRLMCGKDAEAGNTY